MPYSFASFTSRAKEIEEWLAKEMSGLRTGRATPAILDAVSVESYGSKMPIKHVAAISVEDPRTLRIVPYDASLAKEIEKAISSANLGLSISADDKGARVMFPELTAERRSALIKVAKEKLEHARVSLRKLRDDIIGEIDANEKEGGMGEDEKFRLRKDLEKLSEAENKKFQETLERKEREITQ